MTTRDLAINFHEIITDLLVAGDDAGIDQIHRQMDDLDATTAPGLIQEYAELV